MAGDSTRQQRKTFFLLALLWRPTTHADQPIRRRHAKPRPIKAHVRARRHHRVHLHGPKDILPVPALQERRDEIVRGIGAEMQGGGGGGWRGKTHIHVDEAAGRQMPVRVLVDAAAGAGRAAPEGIVVATHWMRRWRLRVRGVGV